MSERQKISVHGSREIAAMFREERRPPRVSLSPAMQRRERIRREAAIKVLRRQNLTEAEAAEQYDAGLWRRR